MISGVFCSEFKLLRVEGINSVEVDWINNMEIINNFKII